MTHQIGLTTVCRPGDATVENRLGDTTVLMNLDTGAIFRLDPVGTRVWELVCDGGTSVEAVCAVLRTEYSGIGDGLEADIRRLMGQLADQRLVTAQ